LTTDWKSDDPMEGAWGFFVSDPDGTCPYVEEQGWTYAWYETDEDLNPLTIVGPYGNTWYFTSEEDFYGGDTCVNDDSIGDRDGDTCSDFYDSNPGGCGGYDTEDFIAARECCACGGGSTGYYEEEEVIIDEECTNDDSVGDIDGDTCSDYYDSNPGGCGFYDTDDFIAARECCVCGGGSTGFYDEFTYEGPSEADRKEARKWYNSMGALSTMARTTI